MDALPVGSLDGVPVLLGTTGGSAGRELAVLVSGSGRARPAAVNPYDVSTFSVSFEPVSA